MDICQKKICWNKFVLIVAPTFALKPFSVWPKLFMRFDKSPVYLWKCQFMHCIPLQLSFLRFKLLLNYLFFSLGCCKQRTQIWQSSYLLQFLDGSWRLSCALTAVWKAVFDSCKAEGFLKKRSMLMFLFIMQVSSSLADR